MRYGDESLYLATLVIAEAIRNGDELMMIVGSSTEDDGDDCAG